MTPYHTMVWLWYHHRSCNDYFFEWRHTSIDTISRRWSHITRDVCLSINRISMVPYSIQPLPSALQSSRCSKPQAAHGLGTSQCKRRSFGVLRNNLRNLPCHCSLLDCSCFRLVAYISASTPRWSLITTMPLRIPV